MTKTPLMTPLLTALALTTALTAPSLAQAKPVTLTTQLVNYGGNNAFLAYYITDPKGGYAGTVWLSGRRARYFEHLTGWMRASGGDMAGLDGVTGASVGSGQALTINVNLPDKMFDAGYKLHVDTGVENMGSMANDVAVPLTAAGAGKTTAGKGIIAAFSYSM
jgi:hypothetical protein